MKKASLLIALLIAALIIVPGCKKPTSQKKDDKQAYNPKNDPLVNPDSLFEPLPENKEGVETDETLVLQLKGSPNTLNPIFVSSKYDFIVVDAIFAGLFTFDKNMDWQVNKDLVENLEESEDHLTFIATIKKDLTWQDGHPFTAHDVVYSWKAILDPLVPCVAQKPTVEPIKQCIALDDYRVKFVQEEPFATAKWNLLFPIIPKHIFEVHQEEQPDLKTGEYYNKQSRTPVANGPYKVVDWIENDRIVLERWEAFKGEKPPFKKIILKIIPDTHMTLLAFEKQDIDVIDQLTPQQFAEETNTDNFANAGYKAWGSEWSFGYIGWNMDGSNPFFNDKDVRYAMTHALNVPLIFEKVFYNLVTPCQGIYHPDSWMYNPEVTPLKYDLKKAAEYLDKAGWLVDPDDGWRYKEIDGKKVKFEFTLMYGQGSSTAPMMSAIFQEDLKRLGIVMKTQTIEWASFIQKIRAHEFQAEMANWGTGTDPDTGWNLWRTEEYNTGRNYGGYSNERVDELFYQGRREMDFAKRAKIYQEIHKEIYEDQPYTFIYNRPILSAFNKRIRGVQFSPRSIYNFSPSFFGWWVKQGEAKYVESMP